MDRGMLEAMTDSPEEADDLESQQHFANAIKEALKGHAGQYPS
jgi:hypothetical protein